MGKKGFFLITILWSALAWGRPTAVTLQRQSWLVFEVQETQTLWKLARHLKIDSHSIPRFVEDVLADNPRVTNPDHLKSGDKILIREDLIDTYVPQEKSFKTYWIGGGGRGLASPLLMSQQKTREQSLHLRPSFGFERLTARQRSSGASATLLSSAKFGLKSEYSWRNALGPSALMIGFDWIQFDEQFGSDIAQNSWLAMELEWQQRFSLSDTWFLQFGLGYFQAPYLFTDSDDDLNLKLGAQPGTSLAIVKDIPWVRSQVVLKFTYLYFGYAGDTFIEDGLRSEINYDYSFRLFNQNLQWGIWGRNDQLLSEVTEQNRLAVGMGLGINW